MIGRIGVLLLLAYCASAPGQGVSQPGKENTGPRKDRHALLVGVTYYENKPEKSLIGPGNDVLLVRKLLLDKFQFGPDQIVVLSEAEGKNKGKDFLPTRANIEREFKRLALVVKPGDQVVIHLSGHGSQQPEQKDSADPELDGLDEIFLPRDVGAWDGASGSLKNAIIDDEFGAWLKAVRDKKASVWITFDSCHSGTMTRGGDDSEKTRDLDPVRDLGIPEQAIKEAVAFAAKRDAAKPEQSRGSETPPPPLKLAKEGGIVAIYACQDKEVTIERVLPKAGGDGKEYGILTYSLCKILTEATEKSKEPITYNELARRIQGQYVQWGRTAPTPLIEGVDRDRQVLGDKVWPGRSSVLLEKNSAGYRINAGALHGLTNGTILAVKPPPGTGDQLIGHVRISDLGAHSSQVEPCSHDKKPLVKDLPDGGACTAVFIDFGDQLLRVAVDPRDTDGKELNNAQRMELEKALQELAGPNSMIRPVAKTKEADWLIRAKGKKIVLTPGAGWSIARAPLGEPRFGPAPIDANLAPWLKDNLTRIARAESLKRLAAGGDPGDPDSAIRIKLELTRKKNATEKVGSIPIAWPAPDILAYDGDPIVIDLANKGRVPIDVTVLYIDSGFGIDCFYPRDGDINRVGPGESILPRVSFKFNNKTAGLEQIVVIAVKANGQPVDFSQLAQPTLEQAIEKAKTRGDDQKQALDTPLGKLLKRGMFGQGNTRGASAEEIAEHALFTVSFNVRPEKRAEGK
jgi:Caspase domain